MKAVLVQMKSGLFQKEQAAFERYLHHYRKKSYDGCR